MFDKKKRAAQRPEAPLIFYSNSDLYYNSYVTEALDKHAIRTLFYILKKTNNRKERFEISYQEILEGAELSCNNYVQKSLKTLAEVDLIEITKVKRQLFVKVLVTAKRLNAKKIA